MSEIKLEFKEHNGNFLGVSTSAQGTFGYIVRAPFGNCQISLFNNFQGVLSNFSGKELRAVLRTIFANSGKTSLIVDINSGYCSKLEKEFNGLTEIKFKTPYTNNTGSSMCIHLLHFQNYVLRINREEAAEKLSLASK